MIENTIKICIPKVWPEWTWKHFVSCWIGEEEEMKTFLITNFVFRYALLNFLWDRKQVLRKDQWMLCTKEGTMRYGNWYSLGRGNERSDCKVKPLFFIQRNKEIQPQQHRNNLWYEKLQCFTFHLHYEEFYFKTGRKKKKEAALFGFETQGENSGI